MLLNGDLMHLDAHLKKTRQSQAEFGSTLVPPVSQALVSQWIRGETRVTLLYALQINARTEGAVTPQDCADMYKSTSAHQPA